MRNIEINISIGMRETEAPVTERGVERGDDGVFKLVLDSQDEFNIDHLESALLQVNYPALRATMSDYLEQASKKKPAKKPA